MDGFFVVIQLFSCLLRYDDMKQSSEGKKKFNLLDSLRAFVKPSISRRMTTILESSRDDEHTLLLRWSGHVDIDPDALLHLSDEAS